LFVKYEKLYNKKKKILYPSEFIVRLFLGRKNEKFIPKSKNILLDLSFGDGRNTIFFKENNFDVYGTEVSNKIIKQFFKNFPIFKKDKDKFKVGFSSNIPFMNNFFDIIIAYNSCYYLLKNEKFEDNLKEIKSKLKKSGMFICTIPTLDTYYFAKSKKIKNDIYKITSDPLNLRNNFHLYGISSIDRTSEIISKNFKIIKKGYYCHDFSDLKEAGYYFILKNN